jgi:hypothetical protein
MRHMRRYAVGAGMAAAMWIAPLAVQAQDLHARIDPGTVMTVRTNEPISEARADGRIFTGTVDQDVMGSRGEVAIPRGSNVELIVRVARDNDLILDLDSVTVDRRRYAISTDANRIESNDRDTVGANSRTGKFVGGGAILGAILGAAVGGGKGAAIGAAAGAGAGATAQIVTSGREVHVPPESLVTFRLDRPLVVGVRDGGYDRDGHHYHRDYEYDNRDDNRDNR